MNNVNHPLKKNQCSNIIIYDFLCISYLQQLPSNSVHMCPEKVLRILKLL